MSGWAECRKCSGKGDPLGIGLKGELVNFQIPNQNISILMWKEVLLKRCPRVVVLLGNPSGVPREETTLWRAASA